MLTFFSLSLSLSPSPLSIRFHSSTVACVLRIFGKANFTATELQSLLQTPLLSHLVEFLSSDVHGHPQDSMIQPWRNSETDGSFDFEFCPLVISTHFNEIAHRMLGCYVSRVFQNLVEKARERRLEEVTPAIEKVIHRFLPTVKSHARLFCDEKFYSEREVLPLSDSKDKMEDEFEDEISDILTSDDKIVTETIHRERAIHLPSSRAEIGCFPSDPSTEWSEMNDMRSVTIFGDVFAYLSKFSRCNIFSSSLSTSPPLRYVFHIVWYTSFFLYFVTNLRRSQRHEVHSPALRSGRHGIILGSLPGFYRTHRSVTF